MGQTMCREVASGPFSTAAAGLGQRVPLGSATRTMPAADERADGALRSINLSRDCVRIDRRVGGVAMRVAVPVRAYRGVALTLGADAAGGLTYRLHLLHADRDLSVTLASAKDDLEIVADWRLWSRFFRLPALVERRPGYVEPADILLGGLPVGDAAPTRRPSRSRLKRRSLFGLRRKPGDLALTALSHGGEREIIAQD